MMRNGRMGVLGLVVAGVLSGQVLMHARQDLGSVNIPSAVTANGQPLSAGTYTVRLLNEQVSPVVGQNANGAKWVEFARGGQARGKELATVLTAAEAREIVEGALPGAGRAKVELLKENDYIRVWINSGGTHYLVHLAVAGR